MADVKSQPENQSVPKFFRFKVTGIKRKNEDDFTSMCFELGADEYVTKPFSPKVLVARCKSILKRIGTSVTSFNISPGINSVSAMILVPGTVVAIPI